MLVDPQTMTIIYFANICYDKIYKYHIIIDHDHEMK